MRERAAPNAPIAFPVSTPNSRATLRAVRAEDYPLPDARLSVLRDTISRRLRGAAVSIPTDTLDMLALDMARVALRWSPIEIDARRTAVAGDGR